MRVPRIYLDQPLTSGHDVLLDPRSAHYLANVLRMKSGMTIIAFDGSGLEYSCTLAELGKKSGRVSVGAGQDPGTESRLVSVLGIGMSRGERMDYVVQKATELGVSVIQPLMMENCEVRLDQSRSEKRLDHWCQVCISACEQSGRVKIPEILPPVNIAEWLESVNCDRRYMLDREQPGISGADTVPASIALLIGPEGGLSENEKALAIGKGFSGLNLGSRTLRTETAPVAALSLFQFLWGS